MRCPFAPPRPTGRLAVVVLALALALGACGGDAASRADGPVRLATTTSTRDSGLLAAVLPPFEERTGLAVDVLGVGTGQALAYGRRGDADLLLVHARALEDAFVAAGHGVERRDVMWNDFLVAGPQADPAGAREAPTPAAALARIAAARAPFVSRGDGSGTHVKEQALWAEGGGRPAWDDYLEAGQGMGPCLVIADEKRAYVLVDRGTFLAFRGRLDLVPLVEGHASLHNPYGAILVHPDRNPRGHVEGARRLLDYLTSPEGRRRIGAFRVDGEVLFHPYGEE